MLSMSYIDKKIWILRNKLRLLSLPKNKRIRLEIKTDGRHLTYILVSLHSMGYGVHIVGSQMLFRELLCLRKSSPIPFIFGGKKVICGFVISDIIELINRACPERLPLLLMEYDFFNCTKDGNRMPYFMHPSVYHGGHHIRPLLDPKTERLVKLGFFGTRDAAFYTMNFHFPILNREEILEVLFDNYESEIDIVKSPVSRWSKHRIAVSLDCKGGDHSTKAFMPLSEYLKALEACDFFLSPPGCVMPISHNLIEGMACGSIPVINSSDYLFPKLQNGLNCLSFSTKEELKSALEAVLAMPPEKVKMMRTNVIRYYNDHLKPGCWLPKDFKNSKESILVNAEEVSVSKIAYKDSSQLQRSALL